MSEKDNPEQPLNNNETQKPNSEAVWDQYISNDDDSPEDEEILLTPDNRIDDAIISDMESVQEDEEYGLIMPGPEDMPDPMTLKLEEIHEQLNKLQRDFQSKFKYDEHKAKIIDELHQELQSYKNDVIRQFTKPLIMDIIQFSDNIRKLTNFYIDKDISEISPEKLLALLTEIPSDIEDILFRQGIMTFICEDNDFTPARQRVLTRVKTSDESKNKTVAESLHPGYEWNGQIIRPEMVAAYVFTPEIANTPVKPDDLQTEKADTGDMPDKPDDAQIEEPDTGDMPDEPNDAQDTDDILGEPDGAASKMRNSDE